VALDPERLAEVLVSSTEEARHRCGLQLRNGAPLRQWEDYPFDGNHLADFYSAQAKRIRKNPLPIFGIEDAVSSFKDHGTDPITLARVEGDDGYNYHLFVSVANGEIVACIGIPPFTYEQARGWLSSQTMEPDSFEFHLQADSLGKGAVPAMIEVLARGPIELHRRAAYVLRHYRIGTKSYGSTIDEFEYRLIGLGRDERTVRPQGLEGTDITEEAFLAVDPQRRYDEYPALDFSLVGLSQSSGTKWVASFDGFPLFGVRSVYLAHSLRDGGLIVVKTTHRQRWHDERGPESRHAGPEEMRARALESFAFVLLLFMVDSAYPELAKEELASYNAGKGTFADRYVQRWQEWEPATWSLGGKTIDARIFRFGDGWTGFTVDDPDRYIAVAAYRVGDTSVRLDDVDGAAYDFDFSMPFAIKTLRDQSSTKPDVASLMRAHARHPDHEAVIAANRNLRRGATPDAE
jgi:hypothetical protein